MGLPKPLTIYTDDELREIGISETLIEQMKKKELGRSWAKGILKIKNDKDIIWFNVENTDFLWQSVDTAVHELLHLKDNKLRHGYKFQDMINDIIMDSLK